MGKLVPVQEKLDEIEEQGQKLRRRQEYLKGERDFLIDAMITNPIRIWRNTGSYWPNGIKRLTNWNVRLIISGKNI